jgi:acyl dehydratase
VIPEHISRAGVGADLPARVHTTTAAQLVRYAGAANDYSGIHYDVDYARRRGFDSVIVHGLLKAAFLAELGQDWAGGDAWYRSFGARYGGTDVVGVPIVCRGRVTSLDESRGLVGVDLWAEGVDGRTTTTATGVIQLGAVTRPTESPTDQRKADI